MLSVAGLVVALMGRKPSTDGGRPVVVSVRLSRREAAQLDSIKGVLSRTEWFRWRLLRELKGRGPGDL